MNKIAFALGMVALVAVAGVALFRTDDGRNQDFEGQFSAFCRDFGKDYLSLAERSYRLTVFQKNMELIQAHNSRGDVTWELGLNQFADMTYEEFKKYYLTDLSEVGRSTVDHCPEDTNSREVPDRVDWQEQGKIQKVKNQGMCGSCWAFSAIAALEGAYAIKTGQAPPELSEQELVDCSTKYGNQGCKGGLMGWAYNYIIDNNIHEGKEYPYRGFGGKCKSDIGKGKFGISKCVRSTPNVEGLVQSLAEAPVAAGMHVESTFMFYRKGIYNPKGCTAEANHGVLAVGYDMKTNPPSFHVKNSWGTIWGQKGFFQIAMGSDKGTCSIAGNGQNYWVVAA